MWLELDSGMPCWVSKAVVAVVAESALEAERPGNERLAVEIHHPASSFVSSWNRRAHSAANACELEEVGP
jgi:hypothetical protein